jgi:hypothetical protein
MTMLEMIWIIFYWIGIGIGIIIGLVICYEIMESCVMEYKRYRDRKYWKCRSKDLDNEIRWRYK